MECERHVLVSPGQEVRVIDDEVVTAIRARADRGVGKKTIARELGVSIDTVRRYVRQHVEVRRQVRPTARRLTEARRDVAQALYAGPAAGNAVVVHRLLGERGLAVSPRTIERRLRPCVSVPAHREPVTSYENQLRGVGFVAINATRRHCPKGQPCTGENYAPS